MSFQEIKLIPVANCITQGHGGAAVALLKGSQPRGPLEAEVDCPQISKPWRGAAPPEKWKLFSSLLKGTNTSLSHILMGQCLLRGHIF